MATRRRVASVRAWPALRVGGAANGEKFKEGEYARTASGCFRLSDDVRFGLIHKPPPPSLLLSFPLHTTCGRGLPRAARQPIPAPLSRAYPLRHHDDGPVPRHGPGRPHVGLQVPRPTGAQPLDLHTQPRQRPGALPGLHVPGHRRGHPLLGYRQGGRPPHGDRLYGYGLRAMGCMTSCLFNPVAPTREICWAPHPPTPPYPSVAPYPTNTSIFRVHLLPHSRRLSLPLRKHFPLHLRPAILPSRERAWPLPALLVLRRQRAAGDAPQHGKRHRVLHHLLLHGRLLGLYPASQPRAEGGRLCGHFRGY